MYRGVILHDTEEWCKIWRGIDLTFQNWHEEFVKFWTEHSKVSRIFTLMGSFWSRYILLELKKCRGVIFHYNEEWCKIWRGNYLPFQNWHEKFETFWPGALEVSQICYIMGSFRPQYMFELPKVQRSYIW